MQETRTLGLVVPDIGNPFFAELIRGAEDEAWERGYALMIGSTVEDREREAHTLELLEERHVDGVIVCSSRLPGAQLSGLLERHRSALLFNRVLERDAPEALVGTLGVDDAHGAMRAVHHLLSQRQLPGRGRPQIGMVAGPAASYGRRRREHGYRTALETTGNEVVASRIVGCSPDEAGGFEATRALLAAHPELGGLFCYNDLVAVGALQACAALGLRVPDDVAVVGCDDIRLASLVTPALTTLYVDKQALGRHAVTLLLDRRSAERASAERRQSGTSAESAQSGPATPEADLNAAARDVTIKPELVVRASAP